VTEQNDVRLKLGRYKKPADFHEIEQPELLEPKSELTLDQEEFPPVIEQKRIVDELDSLREEIQRLESIYQQKVAALDELKKSLLHQAFSGAL